jgi:hypothetical protein
MGLSGDGTGASATSYQVSSGDTPFTFYGESGRGPFIAQRKPEDAPTLDQITDGTSNTVMMSEHRISLNDSIDVRDANVTDVPMSTGQWFIVALATEGTNKKYREEYVNAKKIDRQIGRNWASGASNATSFSTILPPNSPACSDGSDWNYYAGPTSYHTGGVLVLRGDASVQFVADTIDTGDLTQVPVESGASPYGVWGAMGSRDGGEAK